MSQPPPKSPPARRRGRLLWVASVLVVVLALAGGGFAYVRRQGRVADDAARALADRVAAAVQSGEVSTLPFAGGGAARRQQEYAAATKGLGSASATTARVTSQQRDGSTARATVAVRRTVAGGVQWSYDLPLRLTERDGRWVVPDDQRLVHPDLAPGQTLRVRRTQPTRAEILGGDGTAIVRAGAVVDVGIVPSRITSGTPASLAQRVASIVDVDAGALARRVQAASKDAFVNVITLRRTDFDTVQPRLRPLPGVVLRERQQPLAPTRDFARALLGTVGPVTAEMVEQGKGRYVLGDVAGVSGLQRQYDEQLGGTAGVKVEAVPAGGGDARPLFEQGAKPGTPLRLTLDEQVQRAADAALQGLSSPSALVAVDVRTGRVLAVANSPSSGLNRALVGKYAPGSTFKVVTTFSLLQKGLKPTDVVPCPPTASVDGRSFKNFENETFGSVPFRTDFAKSCNTAFVGLSARLANDDLATAAKALGIGREWNLGTGAFSGSVPTTTSAVDRAAAAFGQGRTEVSPLAVTVATAAVARGSYIGPTLVVQDGASGPGAEQLPPAPITTLRSLMRDVVTSGTGTALRSVPGGPVRAKTGTAEFGARAPLRTRAWITGWQGNIAFTAFVEEGKSGGSVAGPVAAQFLRLLAAS